MQVRFFRMHILNQNALNVSFTMQIRISNAKSQQHDSSETGAFRMVRRG